MGSIHDDKYYLVYLEDLEYPEKILKKISSTTNVYGVGVDCNNPRKIKYVVIKSRQGILLQDEIHLQEIRDKYLLSGPRVLVEYGLNAFCDEILLVRPDETMRKRASGIFLCLEDTIATTFKHAIECRPLWLRYVVMIYIYRRVDMKYLLDRCLMLGICDEVKKFLGLIFKTFRGRWEGKRSVKIALSHPRFRHIMDYFNHIHWYEIDADVESYCGLTPEIIVSLAGKQLYGY